MRKGFTLVELSIVLVIIGLLIGGVLVAQSMIETAKVSAQIRQIQQLDIAVLNFKTKYNQLPGDSNLFSPPGDNDGLLIANGCNGGNPCGFAPTQEYANFYVHLNQGGFMSQYTFSATPPGGNFSTSAPILNALPAIIGTKQNILAMSYHYWEDGPFAATDNKYLITTATYANDAHDDMAPGTTPDEQALAIDTKIDDGSSCSGNMGNNCGDMDDYTQTDPSHQRALAIKMLSQVGQ